MTDTAGAISTRRIYTGRVVSLDVDEVRFPNGTIGELEMIRHPGASAVVPFLEEPTRADPHVLLIRQYRYATDGDLYEIPAGRLNHGEDPIDCARRELGEETGYAAKGLKFLTTFYTTPGFTDEKIHIFMAKAVDPGDAALEADEVVTLAPMPFSAALAMIESGEITDGKTILGLLFAAQFVRSR